ncbi:AraC family transcriptional regulator [Gordonia polyisoprenivorans]|uniref:AraC family transcriptional regulator n=2 Tax=Gordonia TaxID=2053 RepID=UPI003A5C5FF8
MIAAASGFASVATLRNRFRAEFSMTPNEFRQETSRKNAGRRESRGSDADLGGGP